MNIESISQPLPDGPSRRALPAGRTAARRAEAAHDGASAGRVRARTGSGSASAPLTREQLEARVEAENAHLERLNQGLDFRVHDGSGQLMVQVVDRSTGEVLRENPAQEFLDLAVRIREMVGAFLDEKS